MAAAVGEEDTSREALVADGLVRFPPVVFDPVGLAQVPLELMPSASNSTKGTGPEAAGEAPRILNVVARGKRPEDITHKGVDLSMACVGGDLPLVAMLLAEGAEQGVDMLAGDAVRRSVWDPCAYS